MAAKLVLVAVAWAAAHAAVAPNDLSLMQSELGHAEKLALMQSELAVTADVVFGGKHADQEKSLMGLLSGGKDDPERSLRLRSLAKEILDEDGKAKKTVADTAATTFPQKVVVKPHEPAKKPLLAKKGKDTVARTMARAKSVASIGVQLAGFEEVLTTLMLSKNGVSSTPMADQVEKIRIVIEDEMLPAIETAKDDDQNALDAAKDALVACGTTKDDAITASKTAETTYTTESPLHKQCRVTEGEDLTAKETCHTEEAELLQTKELLCQEFVTLSAHLSDEAANKDAVSKGVGESDETYIRKINSAFCDPSDLAAWEEANTKCNDATTAYDTKHAECNNLDTVYADKHTSCNNMQKTMDDAACSHAVQNKDACEAYSTCFIEKEAEYKALEETVVANEGDRELEWRGTKRMHCIIEAFADGKIEDSEITACKEKTHATDHLEITYPSLPSVVACTIPDLYPATSAYKLAEFADLPSQAPGDATANECINVVTVNTAVGPGNNVDGCTCDQVSLTGTYSPGALVKCTGCNDISKSQQANSCPDGLKLFAPRSRSDWEVFYASTSPNGNPNFIVDVTRPQSGCAGCKASAMNSDNAQQSTWVTQDGAPWWLQAPIENCGAYSCQTDGWVKKSGVDSQTDPSDAVCCEYQCKYTGIEYGDRFIQVGEWRFGDVDGRHASIAHKDGKTCQIFRSDGTLHPGPRSDYTTWDRTVGDPSGVSFGDRFIEVGEWRFGDVDGRHASITHKDGKTAQIYRDDGTLHPGPRTDYTTNAREAGSPSGIKLGENFIQIGEWRFGDVDGRHASIAHDDGKTAQIYRDDGTLHPGPRTDYNTLSRSAELTCDFSSSSQASSSNLLSGDYTEHCYLAVEGSSADSMTFQDGSCNYHSNNYFCQPNNINLSPNPDANPDGCTCENVELTGTYSPGYLLKCTGCTSVSKSSQANSCPTGTKIFSPRSREDWETFFNSASPLRSPNWIVDVTRNGDGGSYTSCKMNSGESCANAWVTADNSAWWFRDSTYSEPNGDYAANCYLDLWAHPTEQNNADNVVWNDGTCGYSSNAYYCQPTSR